MPYIKQARREALNQGATPATPGELNFAICGMIMDYLSDRIASDGVVDYEILNAILGALESAKLEVYRRVLVPYEEIKKEQNGDVFMQ